MVFIDETKLSFAVEFPASIIVRLLLLNAFVRIASISLDTLVEFVLSCFSKPITKL
ncbi:hypothetical protein SDC9_171498 [bioreactor metagenome]|uniref:Uncharacterized protein n=1 Tax=bioreactor metagenome TaxID=1076179 RepID=A0A645GJK7_9ZZZZ